ncbi:MAG: cytochrome c-type biogenesis protein CcmH [Rhodocyclaceae bacterium]|nr:cytochrome c-type biogenesis protein CcmH [Rhodocyclaceae bacterium]
MTCRIAAKLLLLAGMLCAAPAMAMDAAQEARFLTLSEHLRCLVCQNQSIAESNADLARDLRDQVRTQIEAGRSDDEIASYMVARYGDFVLYKPPVKPLTWALWFGPALLFAGGLAALALRLARRRKESAPDLDVAARERAQKLLESGRSQ